MNTNPDLTLVFPPLWYYFLVPPELVSLAAYMRSKNFEVQVFDLNGESLDYFLSSPYLSYLATNPTQSPHLSVEAAKEVMRNPANFFDLPKYLQAKQTLNSVWDTISAHFAPTRIDFLRFKTMHDEQSMERYIMAATDAAHNPFIQFFEERFIPKISESPPMCLGFIYVHPDQAIPMLTAIYLLRQAGFEGHITILGSLEDQVNFGRHLRFDSHREYAILFSLIDSVIQYEAEQALATLVNTLVYGGDLADVPNLLQFEQGVIVRPRQLTVTDPNTIPTPDYDDLTLSHYLFPQPVLALLTSRGCYWDRCTFCAITKNQPSYRPIRVEKMIDDIEALQKKYGVTWFHFRDMLISPAYLHRFCEELIKRGVRIRWICRARFEYAFTRTLLTNMAKAGCVQIWFGLESASKRILELMDKGISLPTVDRIIRDCSDLGIGVHMLMMYGFPTETQAEMEETIRFVEERHTMIDAYSYSRFTLFAATPIFEREADFNIRISPHQDRLMQYKFDYTTSASYTPTLEEHLAFDQRLMEVVPTPLLHVSHVSLYRDHFDGLPWRK